MVEIFLSLYIFYYIYILLKQIFQLNKEQRSQLNLEYKNSGAKRAVETRLLSFLSYNRYHMPMYAKPGMV